MRGVRLGYGAAKTLAKEHAVAGSKPTPPPLEVTKETGDGFVRLRLNGALDSPGCLEQGQTIVQAIEHIPEENGVLLLNLARLTFLASAGMRILLELNKRSKDLDRQVHLENLPPFVRETLDMSGLGRLFTVVREPEE